mgnify:CR=1 FL=1
MKRFLELFIFCGTAIVMSGIGYSYTTWQWWVAVLVASAICILCSEGDK